MVTGQAVKPFQSLSGIIYTPGEALKHSFVCVHGREDAQKPGKALELKRNTLAHRLCEGAQHPAASS